MADSNLFSSTEGVGYHPFGSNATMLYNIFRYLMGYAGPTGFGSASTAEQVSANWAGAGKVVVVTGASAGLGVETTRVFALRGAEVIMAVRDTKKGQEVADAIIAKNPSAAGLLHVMECDLASIASVRTFVANFKQTGKPLHVLLLNAGVMACPFTLSKDGYELQFATNHLAHFYLTQQLLDTLVKTAEKSKTQGRIVAVSSSAHYFAPAKIGIRLDQLNDPAVYSPWPAYGSSKLANILFARQLQQHIDEKCLPLAAVSLHPGAIDTDLQKYVLNNWYIKKLLTKVLMRPFFKSIAQGAATQVYLATAPEVVAGDYYVNCNTCSSSREAHDKDLAARLWKESERIVAEVLATDAA